MENKNIPISIQPSKEETKIYSLILKKETEFFTKLSAKVLKEGRYEFEPIVFNEDYLNSDSKILEAIVNNRNGLEIALPTPLYTLKQEYAAELCKTHQADAVFFQGIFVHFKNNQHSNIRRAGINYPTYKLSYLPLIYNRSGAIIFNEKLFMQDLGTFSNLTEDPSDTSKFINKKMSREEFKSQFDKNFLRSADLYKRLFQGIRTGTIDVFASLCGNLAKCQLIYEETVKEMEGK